MQEPRCASIQAGIGLTMVTGCVYAAVLSALVFGAPFGVTLATIAGTMPLALAAWALALAVGLGLLGAGIGRYVAHGGHGANGGTSLLVIGGGALFLYVSANFPPDESELARLVARGFGIVVMVTHAANLAVVVMARARAQAGDRASPARQFSRDQG